MNKRITILLAALSLIFMSSSAFATCDFILNVHNNSGKDIKIKDVKYKLHKSSWETLNFGAALDLKDGKESYPLDRKIGRWGFKVTNVAKSCHGSKFRFKFTYNCRDDDSGAHTEHSDIMVLRGDAVEASSVMAHANVQDCRGDVSFSLSKSGAGL